MLPLIRKSADSLVEVMDEKAASGESFDVLKYVLLSHNLSQCVVSYSACKSCLIPRCLISFRHV